MLKVPGAFSILLVTIIAACCLIWVQIFRRIGCGREIIANETQRQVPWGAREIFFVLAVFFLGMTLGSAALQLVADTDIKTNLDDLEPEKTPHLHPLALLLLQDRDWFTAVLCVVSAVIIAPVAEEFLFRLVVQGWLQRCESESFHNSSYLPRHYRRFLPVLATSLIFSLMHFRAGPVSLPLHALKINILITAIVQTVIFAVCMAWLRNQTGATASDLGFKRESLWHDVKIGGLASVAVIPPVYALHIGLTFFLHDRTSVSIDPIPLFLFSLALGYLYQQTGRLLPSIVLHVVLNASSIVLLLAETKWNGG